MADPLSISTGAAGLVSLAIGICHSLVTYYASWKDCDRDIAHLHRYLETVSKNMAHLQSCLNRYDFPAALKQQVEAAILECDSEIKLLETEANLVRNIGTTETRRTTMKTFIRNATYPFKESTLEKMKSSLSRIQSTVDSAVFILGLNSLGALTSTSTSIATEITDTKQCITKISDEMPLIRSTIEQFEQDLPVISAKISFMASDVQDIKEGLYQMRYENRIDHQQVSRELLDSLPSTLASTMMSEFERHNSKQYQIQSSGHEPVEFIDEIDVLERRLKQLQLRCITRPSLLQMELDNSKDRIHRNLAPILDDTKHSKYSSLLMDVCSCSSVIASATSWSISRNLQMHAEFIKSHRKGCPLSRIPADQNRTLRLKTMYRARFLMKTLEISLSLTRGAGGCAIASSLKMRTLFRGDSPAFQLFNKKPLDLVIGDRLEVHEILDYVTDALLKIRVLFREGIASPNDINVDAKTILQSANDWIDNLPYELKKSQVQSARKKLLLGLAELGVPLNHRDFYNEDIFNTVLKRERIYQHYSPQWHIYSSLCIFEPVSQPGSWFGPLDLFMAARELEEYADFFDCGILSTAILSKSQEIVEKILLERPQAIHEQNKVGQTPMHLAADWPWGTTRLVSARAPCDIRDQNGFYPLNYAFRIKNWTTYELLLASDSPVLTLLYSSSSSSGFGLFNFFPTKLPPQTFDKTCTRLVDRRNRLANLALHVLSTTECEDLMLYRPGVLDSKAGEVYDRLVSKGLQVSSALEVPLARSTVYHTPWLTTGEMIKLYNVGFRDIDTFDSLEQTPLMIAASKLAIRGISVTLEWLISKGANPLRRVTDFGTIQLHYISSALAAYFVMNLRPLDARGPRLSEQSVSNLQHGFRLINQASSRDLKDYCQCGCSMNGCSPLNLFLKCTMRHIHYGATCRCQAVWTKIKPSREQCEEGLDKAVYYFVEQLLGIFYENEGVPASAYGEIIRLFVFKTLGLTHTCCKTHTGTPAITQPKVPEEIQEIRDEEREILLELNSLCEEGIIRRANYDGPFHEFLGNFLSEIRDTPRSRLDEAEIRKLEEIGVVLQNNINE